MSQQADGPSEPQPSPPPRGPCHGRRRRRPSVLRLSPFAMLAVLRGSQVAPAVRRPNPANLAAPPPSFAGASRARGAAAAGAGLAGSRFAPIGGGGLSLQDLIAGKSGAEPGRTEGRAEVFSPSPASSLPEP